MDQEKTELIGAHGLEQLAAMTSFGINVSVDALGEATVSATTISTLPLRRTEAMNYAPSRYVQGRASIRREKALPKILTERVGTKTVKRPSRPPTTPQDTYHVSVTTTIGGETHTFSDACPVTLAALSDSGSLVSFVQPYAQRILGRTWIWWSLQERVKSGLHLIHGFVEAESGKAIYLPRPLSALSYDETYVFEEVVFFIPAFSSMREVCERARRVCDQCLASAALLPERGT